MKKKWMVLISLVAIAVMVFGVLSSGAWFTAKQTTDAATVKSATLSLDGAGFKEVKLDIPNMAPGDITGEYKITIVNNGTIDLAWFGNMIVSGDTTLKDVIYIEDMKMTFLGPNPWVKANNGAPMTVDHFITAGKGTGEWPTNWTGVDGLATLSVFDGNSGMAPGSPYEFMGALIPDSRFGYELTFKLGFYPGAGDTYQTKGPMNISFEFNATQVNSTAMGAFHSSLSNAAFLDWMKLYTNAQLAVR
jgi:hypothetical protein